MDPRNPLGRLDRLSRDPRVARVSLELEGSAARRRRTLRLTLRSGREKTFRNALGGSYVDLLDRAGAFLSSHQDES